MVPFQTKKNAAIAALHYIEDHAIIGIGTGTTINIFIEELALTKISIQAVSSSKQTTELLKKYRIPTINFEEITELSVYIDGADAYNNLKQLIKGQGGALTREKILAYSSSKFICIVDDSKQPELFNTTPVAIEVIPFARSSVARSIVKLGGLPVYRTGSITDNGNIILDLHNLSMHHPVELEQQLNNIPGVVANGIFAVRPADLIIVGTQSSRFLV